MIMTLQDTIFVDCKTGFQSMSMALGRWMCNQHGNWSVGNLNGPIVSGEDLECQGKYVLCQRHLPGRLKCPSLDFTPMQGDLKACRLINFPKCTRKRASWMSVGGSYILDWAPYYHIFHISSNTFRWGTCEPPQWGKLHYLCAWEARSDLKYSKSLWRWTCEIIVRKPFSLYHIWYLL